MTTYSRFQQGMIRVLGSALLVMGGALMGVGCEREGPVEKAGKQVDQAVEGAKDKLNPEGPVEKAGKKVDQALNILAFSPKKGAVLVKGVLESAIANAEHNDGADIDELTVKTIYVEKAGVLKRFTARAKGRGDRISKQSCHIYVTVGN